MTERGLDHLVLLQPESITYVTGYHTAGYTTSFAAAIVPANGDPTVVIRHAEQYWYEKYSWCGEPVLWFDGETPSAVIMRALDETGATGSIGIEGGSWRGAYATLAPVLSSASSQRQFDPDADVSGIRLIKSDAEIELMRRAGHASDKMLAAAYDAVRPGMTETELASVMSHVGIGSGSTWFEPGPVSSGEAAAYIHATYGSRKFTDDDQIFIEVDANHRFYFARCMRTIVLGAPKNGIEKKWEAVSQLQDAALDTVKAGVHCQIPDRLIRDGLRDLGLHADYPNKTFYGIGFMMPPTAYEPIEVLPSASFEFAAGMTLHAYVSVDGVNISETVVVREQGVERLTEFSRELMQK